MFLGDKVLVADQGVVVFYPFNEKKADGVADLVSMGHLVVSMLLDQLDGSSQQGKLVGRILAITLDDLGQVGDGEVGYLRGL